MAISIIFNMINVNTPQTNGAIAVGENLLAQWSANAKLNSGMGFLFGINTTFNSFDSIIDTDVIDSPILDNDLSVSGQAQAL